MNWLLHVVYLDEYKIGVLGGQSILTTITMIEIISPILAQAVFDFSFDSFKQILGGFFGLILIIAFVAAVAQIAFSFFINRSQGGADMEIVWKKVIGMLIIIVFSLIWVAIFGTEFIVDASVDGFDSLQGGGTP